MEDFPTFSEINLDPSGSLISRGTDSPIKPNGLPKEVEDLLNNRLGDEYSAHYLYRIASNWCANMNYQKSAKYFENESESELSHAKKIQEYLVQWNHIPIIPTIESNIEFNSLIDIINHAYSIEFNLLEKYSKDQVSCLNIHPPTSNFIKEYVEIQTESVKEYSDLLNALNLIDFNNKLDLLIFERNYFN